MFAGAFAAGYVPFAFSFSASKLRRVTIAGAGLLIGTALIVIIPEGVHMYFDSVADSLHHHSDGAHSEEHHGHTHNHRQMGAALALGFCFMLLVDRLSSGYGHSHSAGSGSLPTVENAP